jgi:soluble lytic murein transglycosylase-like protein
MEIKVKKSLGRKPDFIILYKGAWTWLLIFCLIIGNVNISYAEQFIRIYKKGVIYYYFSNTIDDTKYVPDRPTRQIRLNRFRSNRRLAAKELEPWIKWASQQHKLPASLIKAVIRVESNFNPAATSPKGAQGLMQLMPETAEQMKVARPYNIQENIWAGTCYLGMLLRKFKNNLPLALAAYNAGPDRVQKYQGIPPIKETQNFVRNVCINFLKYSGDPPKKQP